MNLQINYKFKDGLAFSGEPIDVDSIKIERTSEFDFFTAIITGLKNNATITMNTESGQVIKRYNELDSMEFKILR